MRLKSYEEIQIKIDKLRLGAAVVGGDYLLDKVETKLHTAKDICKKLRVGYIKNFDTYTNNQINKSLKSAALCIERYAKRKDKER